MKHLGTSVLELVGWGVLGVSPTIILYSWSVFTSLECDRMTTDAMVERSRFLSVGILVAGAKTTTNNASIRFRVVYLCLRDLSLDQLTHVGQLPLPQPWLGTEVVRHFSPPRFHFTTNQVPIKGEEELSRSH